MLASVRKRVPKRLSKSTIMSIRNLARKGSDGDIEDFIYRVAMNYIANVRDEKIVDESQCLVIDETNYECICPICGAELELDLKSLLESE